jgi:hypothetical protein
MPGKYNVSMAMRVNGVVTAMPGSQSFNVVVEGKEKMTDAERTLLAEFQRKVAKLQRAVGGAVEVSGGTKTRIGLLKRAAMDAQTDNKKLMDQAEAFDNEIDYLINELRHSAAVYRLEDRQRRGHDPTFHRQTDADAVGAVRALECRVCSGTRTA